MKRIGITGGIGSGKTTITAVFKLLGVPVYDSDYRAKLIMNTNPELKKKIVMHFGAEVLHADKTINNRYLASRVFQDRSELATLNQLVHPAVAADFIVWVSLQQAELVMQEAALIFESGFDKKLDAVIVVDAPKELRIQRVMLRNGMSREEVESRIGNQLDESELRARANWILYNDEKQLVIPQILSILEKMKSA
jgi:dephospho-CoA kinase